MSKLVKNILLGLLGILVVLQFFQIDKTNPTAPDSEDLLSVTNPPEEVAVLLKTVCYDCHSYQTKYPWYAYVQPLGWWLQDHIEEGREHLNFSKWTSYPPEKAAHKMEEGYEEVGEGEMPLNSYTWAHAEARLSQEQRDRMVAWFQAQEAQILQAAGSAGTSSDQAAEDASEEQENDH